MTRSKKIFAGMAIVFVLGIAWISYDISRRTTFPGSKPQLQERIKDTYLQKNDTLAADSATHR
ncbi:hypothetical protein KK062_26455 [Fulvivirgaceae bacterium PWU5]|jgi:hypothetical protein|uniref:Uncharacterized protein n=1 Tax=Dawidia cretensis TaxID=2782350 RepID=A0AAP2E2J6_9BACT|nr:hypothetical protein [Dawidia cretensis]MBT1711811.1 hypothetical protein [Dawidia cretensis]